MSKHRKKTYRRHITIAAVVVAAVGAPSAAMACLDWQDGRGGEDRDRVRSASADHWKGGAAGHGRPATEPRATPTAKPAPSAPTVKPAPGAPAPKPTRSAPTVKPAPSAPTAKPAPSAPTVKPAPSTPTAKPTPSAPAPSAPSSSATARVVELVNSERAKAGCSPVKVNDRLVKAAQGHSKDMADHANMSHTGSDGSSPADRITRAGYSWRTYGENVAYGYATPERVMAGWMSSAGHKRNILNCEFKEIGVGLAQPGNYWTQVFGTAS